MLRDGHLDPRQATFTKAGCSTRHVAHIMEGVTQLPHRGKCYTRWGPRLQDIFPEPAPPPSGLQATPQIFQDRHQRQAPHRPTSQGPRPCQNNQNPPSPPRWYNAQRPPRRCLSGAMGPTHVCRMWCTSSSARSNSVGETKQALLSPMTSHGEMTQEANTSSPRGRALVTQRSHRLLHDPVPGTKNPHKDAGSVHPSVTPSPCL